MRLASSRQLERLRAEYEDRSLTYAESGATRGVLPRGYAHRRRRARIGAGAHVFDRAAEALLSWDMHRRSGLYVAADGPASKDSTVILGLGYRLAGGEGYPGSVDEALRARARRRYTRLARRSVALKLVEPRGG